MTKLTFKARILLVVIAMVLSISAITITVLKQELKHYMTVQELIETLDGDEELLIISEKNGIIETCDKFNIDKDLKSCKVVMYGVCPDSYEEIDGELTYIPTLSIIIEE